MQTKILNLKHFEQMAGNFRKSTSIDKIVEILEKEIIHYHLKPQERLIENELSKRFGVSRTPIREAMRILESSGYVVFTPYKGWKVKEVSVNETQEAYVIRAHLASMATESACHNFREADLILLEKIVEDMGLAVRSADVAEYFTLNIKFHDIIETAGGNGTLSRIMQSLDKMTYRYRFLSLSLPGRLTQSLEEHAKIMEALKKKDHEAAAQIAKQSALNSGKLLMKYFLNNSSAVRL